MPEQSIGIPLIWPDIEELPVYRANQFISQNGQGPDGKPEEIVLSLGYIAPPVILGTPEEQQATARALGAVSVKALARVSISRGHVAQLVELLRAQLELFDRAREEES